MVVAVSTKLYNIASMEYIQRLSSLKEAATLVWAKLSDSLVWTRALHTAASKFLT